MRRLAPRRITEARDSSRRSCKRRHARSFLPSRDNNLAPLSQERAAPLARRLGRHHDRGPVEVRLLELRARSGEVPRRAARGLRTDQLFNRERPRRREEWRRSNDEPLLCLCLCRRLRRRRPRVLLPLPERRGPPLPAPESASSVAEARGLRTCGSSGGRPRRRRLSRSRREGVLPRLPSCLRGRDQPRGLSLRDDSSRGDAGPGLLPCRAAADVEAAGLLPGSGRGGRAERGSAVPEAGASPG